MFFLPVFLPGVPAGLVDSVVFGMNSWASGFKRPVFQLGCPLYSGLPSFGGSCEAAEVVEYVDSSDPLKSVAKKMENNGLFLCFLVSPRYITA